MFQSRSDVEWSEFEWLGLKHSYDMVQNIQIQKPFHIDLQKVQILNDSGIQLVRIRIPTVLWFIFTSHDFLCFSVDVKVPPQCLLQHGLTETQLGRVDLRKIVLKEKQDRFETCFKLFTRWVDG